MEGPSELNSDKATHPLSLHAKHPILYKKKNIQRKMIEKIIGQENYERYRTGKDISYESLMDKIQPGYNKQATEYFETRHEAFMQDSELYVNMGYLAGVAKVFLEHPIKITKIFLDED